MLTSSSQIAVIQQHTVTSLFCYTFSVVYTLWIVYTNIYDTLSTYPLQEETDAQ
jgi:Ser-tRNA(Ala) deacylase AlaX